MGFTKDFFLSIVFLLLTFFVSAKAQLNWQETSPIYGGRVLALCKTGSGNIFASTTTGLFITSDEGKTWSLPSSSMSSRFYDKFFVHSSEKIFGSHYNTFEEILDDGKTFRSSLSEHVTGITEAKNGRIYVSTLVNGIFFSADTGKSWNKIHVANLVSLQAILVDDNGNIFAASSNTIYKSTDNGNSWTSISIASGYDVSFLQSEDGTIYLFRTRGYLKSVDHGSTWLEFGVDTLYWSESAQLLPNGEVMVLTSSAIFISHNHVTDWEKIEYSGNIFDASLYTGDKIFCGVSGRGISEYNIATKQWVERNQGLISDFDNLAVNKNGALFASSGYFIYSSTDLGKTWKRVLDKPHYKFFSNGIDNTVFTISDSKILYTSDDGQTWKEINIINPIGMISDAVISPDNIFYVAKQEKLYVSYDFGNTLELIWEIEKPVDHFANSATYLRPGPNGEISFVFAKQCFRSFDYGKHWQITPAEDLPLPYTDHGKTLFVFKRAPWGNLYAGVANELYTISATGRWSLCYNFGESNFHTINWIYNFGFSKNGQMFLASSDKLLLSLDHGKTWTIFSQDYGFYMAKIEVSNNYIFASTANHRLIYARYDDQTVNEPSNSALSNSYPNPFNNQTTIEFYLQQPGDVNLSIFNSIGQKVETVVQNYTGSGFYKINWQPKNLASGIYLYRLQTPKFTETKKMIYLK